MGGLSVECAADKGQGFCGIQCENVQAEKLARLESDGGERFAFMIDEGPGGIDCRQDDRQVLADNL